MATCLRVHKSSETPVTWHKIRFCFGVGVNREHNSHNIQYAIYTLYNNLYNEAVHLETFRRASWLCPPTGNTRQSHPPDGESLDDLSGGNKLLSFFLSLKYPFPALLPFQFPRNKKLSYQFPRAGLSFCSSPFHHSNPLFHALPFHHPSLPTQVESHRVPGVGVRPRQLPG